MSGKSRSVRGCVTVGVVMLTALSANAAVANAAVGPNAKPAPQSPSQKADAAIAAGAKGVEAVLRSGDLQVGLELLKRATVTDSGTPAPAGDGTVSVNTVCHGAVTHRTTISVAGITLGWREVRLGGWCWGGGRITSWQGSTYNQYSAALYCWTNESTFDGWYNSPTRRYTYTRGTLGGNSGFGCVSVGNTIVPAIYYRDGGSYSYTA